MAQVTALDTAAARLQKRGPATEEANQLVLAEQMVDSIKEEAGESPVFSLGGFHLFNRESGLFEAYSMDAMAIRIARQFSFSKLCRKASDYRQIAGLVASLTEDPLYFSEAPAGITAGGSFYHVTEGGEIESKPVDASHRQRTSVDAEPDFGGEALL